VLSKQKIKYVQSLKLKKFRDEHQVFVVEGEKMALELIGDKSIEIEQIIAIETWIQAHQNALKSHFNKILTATEADLKQISNLTTPNKVFVIVKKGAPQSGFQLDGALAPYFDEKMRNNFALYLDGIQDPGNLGTILRIADWFSIPYIFCSPETVEIWNPKVIQSSMGAFLRVSTQEVNFSDLKKRFPELPIFATVINGENIFDLKKEKNPNHGIIVIGNEGKGVSDSVLKLSDYKISIPGGGGAESLNAAVATGIVCSILKS
jgi:RNA methyltransferase, TrmH family